LEMLVFQREENQRTHRKTLGARRESTTNSTHIWHRAGIEPGPHWWEANALTTTFLKDIRINFCEIHLVTRYSFYLFCMSSLQCYLAALENRDTPPAPEVYSKASKVQPPPAPTGDFSDETPAAAPAPAPAVGSVPPAPAPPPALLVPPAEEPDDEEFEEEELQCKVIYDFQGNTLLHFSLFLLFLFKDCLTTLSLGIRGILHFPSLELIRGGVPCTGYVKM